MVGAFVMLGLMLLAATIFVVYDRISYRRDQRARRH
jgi:hypothetical protein